MSGTGHSAFGVVVIAGSTGALTPLREILGRLPAGFAAPVVVALHRAPQMTDSLADSLGRSSRLPVRLVDRATPLVPGVVAVAGAGVDIALSGPGLLTARPPARIPVRESGDVLFASAAAAFGPRTLGVVLSGRMSDGAAGGRAIRAAGGRVLVQHPDSARAGGMPAATMATGCVDYALTPEYIAAALVALVMVRGAAGLFRVRSHPGTAALAAPV